MDGWRLTGLTTRIGISERLGLELEAVATGQLIWRTWCTWMVMSDSEEHV